MLTDELPEGFHSRNFFREINKRQLVSAMALKFINAL